MQNKYPEISILYNMNLFLSKTKSATPLSVFSLSRRTYINTFVSNHYLVQNKKCPEIISHKKRSTVPPVDAKVDTASKVTSKA